MKKEFYIYFDLSYSSVGLGLIILSFYIVVDGIQYCGGNGSPLKSRKSIIKSSPLDYKKIFLSESEIQEILNRNFNSIENLKLLKEHFPEDFL